MCYGDTPLALEPSWPLTFWLRPPRKSLWIPFNHFCTLCSRSSPEQVLLLTAPLITLLCCNNLNPATVLPSVSDKVCHNTLTLMDHLLTPHDDLREIPLNIADFLHLMDGSYLKDDNGKYCAEYAIANPLDIVEAAHLPMATLAQKDEYMLLHGLVI